ncbi:MAG: HK97-like phage protein [Clostridiales bacterium]|jgi:hypothetical protein|nr:HK97-like phage protein [Clostridiales bacterium]
MAKMTIRGTSEFELKLSKLADLEITKDVVYAGAQPVANEIRKRLKANLEDSEESTGDLLDSLGIAPPDVDMQGNVNTKVGFDGYDEKGTPNQLKARVMESGSITHKKKPFIRPAVNATKKIAIKAMEDKLDEKISKIMNRK